jgi:hypothetical protein
MNSTLGLPAPVKHWSMAAAFEQVAKCDFECEGGPLKNNDAWRFIVGAAKVGPEFWPGQGVWFEIQAEISGIKISKWAHFYIVGCSMGSDTEKRLWTYSLSSDPPSPYHYGTVQFTNVRSEKLALEKPVDA